MKSIVASILTSLLALCVLQTRTHAQSSENQNPTTPLLVKPQKPNEVTVVLDDQPTTPTKTDQPSDQPAAETAKSPPDDTTATDPSDTPDEPQTAEPKPDDTQKEPPPETTTAPPTPPEPANQHEGVTVHVEKIKSGSGELDASKIKLRAPFPAKPLTQAPSGWRLQPAENTPPFSREVELSPGKKVTLSIRPHILVPEADGTSVFNIAEPGFDPALGYQQNATVGAILSTSIRQLEEDSKQMGTAIDKLQQLLGSLPKPPPSAPPAPPATAPITKPLPRTSR